MYYLLFGFLYLLSLLPLRVLYLLSDFAYFIIYHVAGYRKKVVLQNLAIAFPEKGEAERLRIAKKFYRNFTDNFIETIKFISASERFFKKRFTGNLEVLQPLYEQGRSCQVHLAHNFNWELANLAVPLWTPYRFLTVYMPIGSKAVDRLFRYIRSRTGSVLLPATGMRQAFLPYRGQQYLMALVADQNAGNVRNAYWFNFFGRPAPFVKGPEKGARANNAAVVFAYITRKKRGYYEANLRVEETEPAQVPDGELTGRYVRYLEEVIRANPEMWLWSHRRWKHEWKPEYGDVREKSQQA
ncbi:lysophospholipid acyltransferase family protein [Paraflavisolibacter sp. H34]|uniref:lysophospholipid acyltransferase family protein n=1 Tax=Huijunlia imazamoxiresistens TaxID=3127457 RepID=UPI003016BB57